jgi:hypothetical protein
MPSELECFIQAGMTTWGGADVCTHFGLSLVTTAFADGTRCYSMAVLSAMQ